MDTKPPAGNPAERIQPEQVRVVKQDDFREEYANSVQVNVSVWDFFLQFGRIKIEGENEVTFASYLGVYMSPQQAKALNVVLSQNIAQYESAFGKIQIDNAQAGPGRSGMVQ